MNPKSIKRVVVGFFTTLVFASNLGAQVYQWKDSNGKTIFSDKPPPGKVLPSRPPPSTTEDDTAANAKTEEAKAPKTLADRELDFRKRQKESQEAADKRRTEEQQAAERQESCANNKRYLQLLESGERVAQRDDQGERNYLDDKQRELEINKTRQALQNHCK